MKSGIYLVIAGLMLTSAAMADVKETEEFTLDIEKGGRLSLENINGGIKIVGGGGTQVEILAKKKAGTQEYMDDLQILIDEDGDGKVTTEEMTEPAKHIERMQRRHERMQDRMEDRRQHRRERMHRDTDD